MNQTYVIHAFYRCQAREGSNLRNLLSPLWGHGWDKKKWAREGSNLQNLLSPLWGHGWDKKKVGARGLEPPNLTDVNRAL
jgi:hypothetical protein